MTLADVKEFLKDKIDCPNWFVGKKDTAKEQSITIYPTQGVPPIMALGGLVLSSYTTKAVSILVHWGNQATPAELKAKEVYDSLFGQSGTIGPFDVIKFDMRTSEPLGMGTEDNGIYEYVINLVIYYKKV